MSKSKAEIAGITVEIRHADAEGGELTAADAMAILGWQTEYDADGKQERKFGDKYAIKDKDGNKVRFTKNATNRPIKTAIAERYANEMLRGEWQLNGETMVIDSKGAVISAQHRLVALVFANQIYKKNKDEWKGYGHKGGQVTIPAIIVSGISPKKEVADTNDTGQKRSLGDVVFRNRDFKGKKLTEKEQRKCAWALSIALRLVWLRMGGKLVSTAKHFPHSEAMLVQKQHPRTVDAVLEIFALDNQTVDDVKGKNLINDYVTIGYASALFYLMATSDTAQDGETSLGNWDVAQHFWSEFVKGESDLMKVLKNKLKSLSAAGSSGRDEICGTIVKAWFAFIANTKDVSAKDITVKHKKKDGKTVLAENPRFGGLDMEIMTEDDAEGVEEEATEATEESTEEASV